MAPSQRIAVAHLQQVREELQRPLSAKADLFDFVIILFDLNLSNM
jgi:hypothetical protein